MIKRSEVTITRRRAGQRLPKRVRGGVEEGEVTRLGSI